MTIETVATPFIKQISFTVIVALEAFGNGITVKLSEMLNPVVVQTLAYPGLPSTKSGVKCHNDRSLGRNSLE